MTILHTDLIATGFNPLTVGKNRHPALYIHIISTWLVDLTRITNAVQQ